MKKLFLLFSILFSINVYAQIQGNDIIDPLFSDNIMCIYLKNHSSDNISVVVYNNYQDSLIQINDVYLFVDDNLIDRKQLNNNEVTNNIDFNIITEYYDFKIIITINNNDNWVYDFNIFSKYRWYDMVLCQFTRIIDNYFMRIHIFTNI